MCWTEKPCGVRLPKEAARCPTGAGEQSAPRGKAAKSSQLSSLPRGIDSGHPCTLRQSFWGTAAPPGTASGASLHPCTSGTTHASLGTASRGSPHPQSIPSSSGASLHLRNHLPTTQASPGTASRGFPHPPEHPRILRDSVRGIPASVYLRNHQRIPPSILRGIPASPEPPPGHPRIPWHGFPGVRASPHPPGQPPGHPLSPLTGSAAASQRVRPLRGRPCPPPPPRHWPRRRQRSAPLPVMPPPKFSAAGSARGSRASSPAERLPGRPERRPPRGMPP
ncbi:basic salivary proline-rich protein 1-like [Passer domesticus]|uniref:basic salivary proline-rich protein 1-like n=1 Tax=Passer domesticus TaxID=48849 RepID=UPI0030FE9839